MKRYGEGGSTLKSRRVQGLEPKTFPSNPIPQTDGVWTQGPVTKALPQRKQSNSLGPRKLLVDKGGLEPGAPNPQMKPPPNLKLAPLVFKVYGSRFAA